MKKILLCFYALLFLCSCKTVDQTAAEPTEPVIEQIPVETIKPEVLPEPEPLPTPKPTVSVAPPNPQPKEEPKPEDIVVATFGEITITKKDYIDTKAEVELVVEELNKITAASDYSDWLKYLSDDYRKHYSNKAALQETSKQLPIKGITLNTLHDYFTYVFVPARKNVRVDDITFTSATTVDVIMKTSSKWYYVYTLEKEKNGWKIVDRLTK